ncbi:alpha/beta hydrolase [Nocardia sp. NPDC051833]|uniref:alpha/beta hydrolase n=1 Tax=Nocardia sp. NPDC051833 TaxID=3155674 RepID=UPI00342C111C
MAARTPSLSQRLIRCATILCGRTPAAILNLFADAPTNKAGSRMAPEIALLMKAMADGPDYSDHEPVRAREMPDADSATLAEVLPPLYLVEDLELPGGLAATRYRASAESAGLLVYFHGGGFVLGNRTGYDAPARRLAIHSGLDVLAVEYREHPFPAPLEDALTAWDFAVALAPAWGIPATRVAVGGDSAGANIATVLASRLRGRAVVPAAQALLYPVTDLSVFYDSHREFSDSPALSVKQIGWFVDHYLPPGIERHDPRVSPMQAQDLSGLPPAVVAVAGFDPLRDEGIDYAERLAAEGVPTRLLREEKLVHGFISFTAFSRTSRAATVRFAEAIAEVMTPNPLEKAKR